MAHDLLNDFVSVTELARQLNKSERTIYRWVANRKLAYLPGVGVHVPSSREAMLARVIPAVGAPRRRRSA